MSATPSALRSTIVISLSRGVAALLALAQGILSAGYFGTRLEKDCFLIAQTIPTMFTTFLIGGLYSTLLVNLSAIGQQHGVRGQKVFANRIFRTLTWSLIIPVGLVLVTPMSFIRILAPGFSEAKATLTASLLPFTVLGAVGLLYLAGVRCMYQTRGQFTTSAMVSLINPLISLVVLVAFVRTIGIYSLAAGSLLGVALTLVCLVALIPAKLKDPAGFTPEPLLQEPSRSRLRQFWLAFLPMSFAANFGQINVTVDNAFASYLPTGSITMLAFAFVVVSNTQLMTTSPFAEVAFTRLSSAVTANSPDLRSLFRSQLRHVFLITAPISCGAFAFATPIVRLLFERGEFGPTSTAGVATLLRAYAPGILCFGFLTLLSLFLMARRQFHLLAIVAAFVIILNAALDLLLIRLFGVVGIAMGTSLIVLTHALFLVRPVYRRLGPFLELADVAYLIKVLLSSVVMAGSVFLFSLGFEGYFDTTAESARFIEVGTGLGLGFVVNCSLLLLFRVEEVRVLLHRLLVAARRLIPRFGRSTGPS